LSKFLILLGASAPSCAALEPAESNLSDLNEWVYRGIAIRYCDLVITENQMNDLLRRADEYAPKTMSRLTDLLKL
jgi:hypothetical protein